jgi:hypothetical protein
MLHLEKNELEVAHSSVPHLKSKGNFFKGDDHVLHHSSSLITEHFRNTIVQEHNKLYRTIE